MKISEYIKNTLENTKAKEISFDIGIGKNQTVNDKSPTRVKFTVVRKE